MPEIEQRRRRRPAVSCKLCRQRKIRCDRESPCNNCRRAKGPQTACVYDSPPEPAPSRRRQNLAHIAPSKPVSHDNSIHENADVGNGVQQPIHVQQSHLPPTPASLPGHQLDVETLKSRIAQLEEQVLQLNHGSPASNSIALLRVPDEQVEAGGADLSSLRPGIHHSELFGTVQFASRSLMHKKRLFGQSHWANGVAMFRDIFEGFQAEMLGESNLLAEMHKCKELGRIIKARREPSWPTMPSPDLPPRDLADKLVECYLRTTESVYRIMHIPTLWKNYEAIWAGTGEPDMSLIIPLKLIFAIGAASYDIEFSLKESACLWVHESITWLSRPDYKGRICIKHIQTSMLLILAREVVGVGWSMIWTSMGEVMRAAVFAGLHRDPSRLPRQSLFASEHRRRLWNTLLEMDLHASLITGAPPFMSMSDFDCQVPGNYDDEQLAEKDPKPKPEDEFTNMSIPRTLRTTYPVRLAIVKFLNEIGSGGTYKETLHLDTALRTAYKPTSQNLRQWESSPASAKSPSSFQTSFVDTMMRRSLVTLHVPFFGLSFTDTSHAFTRKVIVDNCLVLWRVLYTPSSDLSVVEPPGNKVVVFTTQTEFSRLAVYRSGIFRGLAIQVVQLLLGELRAQVRENDALGTAVTCSDLYALLHEGKNWCLQCIHLGETNIKGVILISMIAAQIKAFMRGTEPADAVDDIYKAVSEAKDICMPILERWATVGETVTSGLEDLQQSAGEEYGPMEDWDFTAANNDFTFGLMNPSNWLFDDMMQVQEF